MTDAEGAMIPQRHLAAAGTIPTRWADLRRLVAHRELLWVWTLRSVRVRYRQSVLGVLWAIAQPLSMLIVYFSPS